MPKGKSSKRAHRQSPDANEILVMELQEIHSAETQLARLLPRFAKAVEAEELRRCIEQRQEESERIIEELDAAFDELEERPGRKRNPAAEGLISDAREHVQELAQGPARDVVLLGAMQKLEHYCIAAWGTARSLAEALGEEIPAGAMERALEEGKAFDERLTELAESEVNPALLSSTEESESDEEEEAPAPHTRARKESGSSRRVAQ
ncbi:MAG: ferritin-like domain-containing protein [Steroidobacteraceae bacterium]